MVHPDKCGVGGYLLVGVAVDGATGRVWSVDANSRAPAAAYEGMFNVSPVDAGAPRGLNENEYDCTWSTLPPVLRECLGYTRVANTYRGGGGVS